MSSIRSTEPRCYIPTHESSHGTAKVIYESKDGKTKETFDALDWLALLTTHIPNRGEQMVRCYGYYSNKFRGMRKRAGRDNEVSALIDSDVSRKAFRMEKIYFRVCSNIAFEHGNGVSVQEVVA